MLIHQHAEVGDEARHVDLRPDRAPPFPAEHRRAIDQHDPLCLGPNRNKLHIALQRHFELTPGISCISRHSVGRILPELEGDLAEDRFEDRLLVTEMMIERASTDRAQFDQIAGRRRMIAVAGEDIPRGCQKASARIRRSLLHPTHTPHRRRIGPVLALRHSVARGLVQGSGSGSQSSTPIAFRQRGFATMAPRKILIPGKTKPQRT